MQIQRSFLPPTMSGGRNACPGSMAISHLRFGTTRSSRCSVLVTELALNPSTIFSMTVSLSLDPTSNR